MVDWSLVLASVGSGTVTVSVASTLFTRLIERAEMLAARLLYVPATADVTCATMEQLASPAARVAPLTTTLLLPAVPVTEPPHCGDAGTAASVRPAGRVSVKAMPFCS